MRSVAAEYPGRHVPGVYGVDSIAHGVIALNSDVSPCMALGAAPLVDRWCHCNMCGWMASSRGLKCCETFQIFLTSLIN